MMVQALVETIFDVCYLSLVITVGVIMLRRRTSGSLPKLFGLMAVLLGAGDAFHLVPRVVALWTTGLEANAAALGVGKLITSITMTMFYLILYCIWRAYYGMQGQTGLTRTMWLLAIVRIFLCMLTQNEWLNYRQPLFYSVLRNIPFAMMGIGIIALFWRESRKREGDPFRHMPLAVLLSFGFYLPVVLWADNVPLLGMLMIPKTIAYVWVVAMGWKVFSKAAEGQ